MAAPPLVTTKALNGKFTLNKSLSDNADEILRLQGVSWFKRSAIGLFVPTLYLTHAPADSDAGERIDVVMTLSGGLAGAVNETHVLDGQEREKKHDLFGFITGTARRAALEEVADVFLKVDWTQDCVEHGIVVCEHRNTPSKNSHTWKAVQVWGIAMVEDERRYVRRTTFTSPQKDSPVHVRLVYDYAGAV